MPPSIIKHISACTILLLSTFTVRPVLATDFDNIFWEKYSEMPVKAELTRGQNKQSVELKGFEDGILNIEMSFNGTVAQMGMKADKQLAKQLKITIPKINELKKSIRDQQISKALQIMRPNVYPLLAYHKLPSSYAQVHKLNGLLLKQLIDFKLLEEAYDLVSRLSLSEAHVYYSSISLRLIKALIATGSYLQASELIASLPTENAYTNNLQGCIDATHMLRDAQQLALALPLYKSFERRLKGNQLKNIQLWISYCMVNAGEIEASKEQLSSLIFDDPKEKNFPLYQFVKGSIAHQSKQHVKALDHLAKGFVYSQSSDQWVPAMLFTMGDCYLKIGNRVGARNVWLEITQLYKDSLWYSQAQSALANNKQ